VSTTTKQSTERAEQVVYPACYEAAAAAYGDGMTPDEAYAVAKRVAERMVKENGGCGYVTAMNAAYEATVAATR